MDFTFPEELVMLRDTIRRFVDRELELEEGRTGANVGYRILR